jgi:hypothetical protein
LQAAANESMFRTPTHARVCPLVNTSYEAILGITMLPRLTVELTALASWSSV